MSRSEYIWLVLGMAMPVAAFKRKYECEQYLCDEGWFDRKRPTWRVYRLDGTSVVLLTKEDFN